MPYKNLADLPDKVKNHLPKHAQEIFLSAFNHAYKEYKTSDHKKTEETAFKVAWSAVERKYEKSSNGEWVSKLEV